MQSQQLTMEAKIAADRKARGVRYCGRTPRSIPKGRVLIHNHVKHTEWMPYGENGFRCWTEFEGKQDSKWTPCPCKWSGLPHYALREHVKAVKALKTKDKCWTAAQCGLPSLSRLRAMGEA